MVTMVQGEKCENVKGCQAASMLDKKLTDHAWTVPACLPNNNQHNFNNHKFHLENAVKNIDPC